MLGSAYGGMRRQSKHKHTEDWDKLLCCSEEDGGFYCSRERTQVAGNMQWRCNFDWELHHANGLNETQKIPVKELTYQQEWRE
jgi:hypothetical protein